MGRKTGFNRPQKRKYSHLHRLVALFLCLVMAVSLSYHVLLDIGSLIVVAEQEGPKTETRAETKARLMLQIRSEGWDPYSSDMTIDEFYALMELFEEGVLPLRSVASIAAAGAHAAGVNAEGDDHSSEEALSIPRTMFLYKGLNAYQGENPPLGYSNTLGAVDENGDSVGESDEDYVNYPAELDPYGNNYQRPPKDWSGVKLGAESKAVVIVPGINNTNDAIAGDVDQKLFQAYNEYYVRRVTAENTEVTILGAIKLPGQDNYVYYYLTDDKQSTDVSTTMLADGKKFIVEYSPIEHTLEYEVHRNTVDGDDITNDPVDANVLGTDLSDTWENIVFGTNHPNKTDGSAYSFTAYAPYGYTVEFYLVKTKDEENGSNTGEKEWGDPTALLGKSSAGTFTNVNSGWALGMEPDYINGSQNGATILPNTVNGPPTLTMSGNIFNNNVHHDRKIIAVVHENDAPTFLVAPLNKNTNNVSKRGTSAHTQVKTIGGSYVPYDYEDVYLWSRGEKSRYAYDINDPNLSYAGKDNLAKGNVATCDKWQWQFKAPYNNKVAMQQETDGTYSYQWTWQTNSDEGGYTLDALEINGVAVTLPFFPKRSLHSDYTTGTSGGSTAWRTETNLPNGIHIKVEFLMVFHPENPPQRVYRITATGARSNVTISAMNLITGNGAPEFSAYQLAGVTDGAGNVSTIEYYLKQANNPETQWRQAHQGNIYVDSNENGENVGINFSGDDNIHGANLRFKLADGYASPYYLWEGMLTADTIQGQASIARDHTTGEVIYDTMNPVKQLSEAEGPLDPQYIYAGDDGWYYIRVTTQGDNKVALLTIGAKQVRYVVRYIPGTISDTGRVPTGMPTFDHTGESDFEIDQAIAEQYDTKDGAYYDVTEENVIILPLATPSDPNSQYKFVDWVLVDRSGNVIQEQDGTEYHFSVTHINLADVIDYAIQNDDLGGAATDIYVLRLMPNWEEIQNPFHYNVALNWVDAQGNLHTDYFEENWKSVLTNWDINGGRLTVQVIKDAVPFLDWIAQHPTYSFWDAVNKNNALFRYYEEHEEDASDPDFTQKAYNAMAKEMEKAIAEYLPALTPGTDPNDEADPYYRVLNALCNRDISGWIYDSNGEKTDKKVENHTGNGRDDFWRLGEYAYQVFEDYATIVVWMYETKGGLAFRKEVKGDSFIPDDEFYFTISSVLVGNGQQLNGEYKAYPEKVYDENGNPRPVRDSDAWLVTFKGGKVTSIVKNGSSAAPTDYFTLKNGDGILLYVPNGTYTITELGSKSGGAYRVEVLYDGKNGVNRAPTINSNWTLPDGHQWLRGSATLYYDPDNKSKPIPADVSQVSATVYFEVGENNMVHTLQFNNATATLSIEKVLDVTEENEKEFAEWLADNPDKTFHFSVKLELPAGHTPLVGTRVNSDGEEETYYYFNMIVYGSDGSKLKKELELTKSVDKTPDDETADGETADGETADGETADDETTWIGSIDLQGGQRAAIIMTAPDDGKDLYYSRWTGEEFPVKDKDEIFDMNGQPYFKLGENYGAPLYYYADEDKTKKVYILSWDQIQIVKKVDGEPYLIHSTQNPLYYFVGWKNGVPVYDKLPSSPSDVNVRLVTVGTVSRVYETKNVVLYYYNYNDSEYQLIKNYAALKAIIAESDTVYYEWKNEYYPVTLTKIDDPRYDDGYSYDGVYSMTGSSMGLKKDFEVCYSTADGQYFPVKSLDDILIQVNTKEVPVSKELFNYEFQEVWKKEEWSKEEWDSTSEKTKLFIEDWTKQSGIADTGELTQATIVNWYKALPENGYLAITETHGDPNDSFLYQITDKNGNSIIVSVKGGGVTYVCAPAGEYTVREVTNWAWRYKDGLWENSASVPKGTTAKVKITAANNTPLKAVHADFSNSRNDKVWLGGETSKDNRCTPVKDIEGEDKDEGGDTDPPAQELFAFYSDEKKNGMILQANPSKRIKSS